MENIYPIDKKFRKRVYDFNQDMKNLTPYYVLMTDGTIYPFEDKEIMKYKKNGGFCTIINQGFTFLENFNHNILLDATAIYEALKTAKGLSDTIQVKGKEIGILKDDAFQRLGFIVREDVIPVDKSEYRNNILNRFNSIKDTDLYWLNENELDRLLNRKKHISINRDGMFFRISKGTLSHLRKTDLVGIYMRRLKNKYEKMLEVMLVCQRESFISIHIYRAVDFKS